MEITLEKIELVKDRTGATYKEAKVALEKADGNVVDAIISIEQNIDRPMPRTAGGAITGGALIAKMKEIVLRGNVTKIVIGRNDKQIMDIPLNLGVAGLVIAPWGVIVGLIAALGFNCTIDMIKEDGTVVSLSDKAGVVIETVKSKGGAAAAIAKEKGGIARSKMGVAADNIKDSIQRAANKSKEKDEAYTAEDFDAEWFENDEEFTEVVG